MLTAEKLQQLLREFSGPLSGIEVKARTEAAALLTPHVVDITGVVNIHGKPTVFQVEDFDLRRMVDIDDVTGLASQFLESFRGADSSPQFRAMNA